MSVGQQINFIVILIVFISSNKAQEWHCGTDKFQENLSEAAINNDCRQKRTAFAKCCQVHDQCYDQQLGREQCDEKFCTCVKNAAAGASICELVEAPNFCTSVKLFGGLSYMNAGLKKRTR